MRNGRGTAMHNHAPQCEANTGVSSVPSHLQQRRRAPCLERGHKRDTILTLLHTIPLLTKVNPIPSHLQQGRRAPRLERGHEFLQEAVVLLAGGPRLPKAAVPRVAPQRGVVRAHVQAHLKHSLAACVRASKSGKRSPQMTQGSAAPHCRCPRQGTPASATAA